MLINPISYLSNWIGTISTMFPIEYYSKYLYTFESEAELDYKLLFLFYYHIWSEKWVTFSNVLLISDKSIFSSNFWS